ncbi:uncharacterized protein LOC123402960 [Hordeum vulgare subsp. vulgare]|uniref:DUF7894 domain-containing protein n=2 Tax=Hordeum vulgare subsp. vulgare TaxID=112509 RepID=A0A8I6YSV2_HORVV|nr:uncharacterized protein LOC123402960 [Hordeum vulgare subsp. vulgare]KAI4980171.1 hypothetical protein ZWY2020_020656 [Hordeum vulgare]
MRVAARVVVLARDAAGYGAALADALRPSPGLTRGSSPFELPLDKYGLNGEKASGELVSFSDSSGSPQVSFFVLPDYRPPVAACAMNEILALISSEAPSIQPVLIVPFITRPSSATKTGQLTTLHAAEIGASNEFTHLFVDGTTKTPPSLQIRSEPIQCLLEMVRVLKIPTVLLVTSGGQHQGKSSSGSDLEVLQCVGDHVAKHINLEFSKEIVIETGVEKSASIQEPWRELYM